MHEYVLSFFSKYDVQFRTFTVGVADGPDTEERAGFAEPDVLLVLVYRPVFSEPQKIMFIPAYKRFLPLSSNSGEIARVRDLRCPRNIEPVPNYRLVYRMRFDILLLDLSFFGVCLKMKGPVWMSYLQNAPCPLHEFVYHHPDGTLNL